MSCGPDVAALIGAYDDLCSSRCCNTSQCDGYKPANLGDLCGDGGGLISEIHSAVSNILGIPGCKDTLGPSDPGGPPSCVTSGYISDLVAWIDGITCKPAYPVNVYQTGGGYYTGGYS